MLMFCSWLILIRCLEWMDCCCAGTERNENSGEGFISFPSSSSLPCRDFMFPHNRITSCDLLDQLPSSVGLDSGIHAEALMSNQAAWLNISQKLGSTLSHQMSGTRVLIPLSLGLVELFTTKQVPEDGQVIELIRTEWHYFLEQLSNNSATTDSFSSDPNAQKDPSGLLHQQISPKIYGDNPDLPRDVSNGRIHSLNSRLNLQHMRSNILETGAVFMKDGKTYDSSSLGASLENGFHYEEAAQSNMMSSSTNWMQEQMNDGSFTCENNRSEDSDPNDDEDDNKYRRRNGKGPQAKNLEAERKRRKKLNDRLYSLRALVPNISKLDRASILGDAIDYVKELQKEVKDLQMELEENSDDEDVTQTREHNAQNSTKIRGERNGTRVGLQRGDENLLNGFKRKYKANISNKSHEIDHADDKVQQMEPQVEVFQLDGNEFFVKIFSEHKPGGFLRLMEALSSLGLEVTNVNASRHTCLVSSTFKVEQKSDDNVQADHVKESLLELTRNPSRMWPIGAGETENGGELENNYLADHIFN